MPAQVTSATPARPSGANVTVKELLDWLMPRLPENMKEQMSHAQVARWLFILSACWPPTQAAPAALFTHTASRTRLLLNICDMDVC